MKHLLASGLYLSMDLELMIHAPRLAGTHWNWIGHILNLVLALLASWTFRLSAREVGLRLMRGSDWRWLLVGCLVASFLMGGINLAIQCAFKNHNVFHLEDLLFEASLPGLAEELAYRGVAFALILRGYRAAKAAQSELSTVVITGISFGLTHALTHRLYGWHFAWIAFGTTLLFGLWCGFLRWRTSSVLVPALAHNTGNCAGLWASSL
jgi:membrane protease YdiL (CAAX protease family)